MVRPNRAGESLHFEHAVHVSREGHLDRVGILIRQRLHADDCLAFVLNLHSPIDPMLGARGDLNLLCCLADGVKDAAVDLEHDLDGFLRRELVVDVGREHDLVFFDEESGRLQPNKQVLAGDNLRLGLADLGARAHGPALDLPGRQAVGQSKLYFGGAVGGRGEGGGPEGGVGEVGAEDGLSRRLSTRTIAILPAGLSFCSDHHWGRSRHWGNCSRFRIRHATHSAACSSFHRRRRGCQLVARRKEIVEKPQIRIATSSGLNRLRNQRSRLDSVWG